jgi:YHS domain-containing protein
LIVTFALLLASLMPQQAGQQQQPPPVDHSAHAAPSPAAQDDCVTAQSKVIVTGTAARTRLEAAQRSNEPAQLRAAVDDALLAVNALLAATAPCRTPQADHSGHGATPANPGAAGSPRPSTAADPHSGHAMPPAGASSTPAPKPVAKPADPHAGHIAPAPRAAAPKPAPKPDPHAGHQMPAPAQRKPAVFADDPKKLVCSPAIDPDAAPTATYKGKAYYFCTDAERLRFISNPETYLREKGAGR